MPEKLTMDKLTALCKVRGYIFAGSEIYGGLANTWDYGPLGVEFKNNIKKAWWKKFVQESRTNVGLDSSILMNRQVWVASGHVGNFNDPLMDCKACKARFRADQLIEDFASKQGEPVRADGWSNEELESYINERAIPCPICGKHDFTGIRKFNMMFKTHQGVTEDSAAEIYLRPETAQGIFVNFKNIVRSTRRKLPMGVCQIGKSFRNEITPGNFIFRTREFEQMELEFFVPPAEGPKWYEYWCNARLQWYVDLGIPREMLRIRPHDADELSHYSAGTSDVEYMFPWGWGELEGIAQRTDFDLGQHSKHSGERLDFFDQAANERYVPYVVEPAAGANRTMAAFLLAAYDEDVVNDETRTVLRLHPRLAPYKVAVLPLSKKDTLTPLAKEIYAGLSQNYMCDYDETQAIGRRYRRQDEIGTPLCVTVDFDSLEDRSVTIRHRDSTEQVRVPIADLAGEVRRILGF